MRVIDNCSHLWCYVAITLTNKGKLLAEELGDFRDDVEDIIAKGLGLELYYIKNR